MSKRQILKEIKTNFGGNFPKFKDYDASFQLNGEEIFVKIIPATRHTIVTVNSKIIWELKKGRFDGPRFKTSNKSLIDLRSFMKYPKKIIIFLEKPYKVLQALNESDLKDISDDNFVHGVHYFSEVKDIKIVLNSKQLS